MSSGEGMCAVFNHPAPSPHSSSRTAYHLDITSEATKR